MLLHLYKASVVGGRGVINVNFTQLHHFSMICCETVSSNKVAGSSKIRGRFTYNMRNIRFSDLPFSQETPFYKGSG